MIHQRYKDLCFGLVRPAAKFNHAIWTMRLRRKQNGQSVYLHLGCGPKYAEGFLNLDVNFKRKVDMWLDLRNGLPFPPQSVDGIYSCHFFEHLYMDELHALLRECRRVLKPSAGGRFLVPSLEQALQAYIRHDAAWFSDFPVSYQSLGGRLVNYLLCDSQHRLMFDFSFLEEVLNGAGFRRVARMTPGESQAFPAQVLQQVEGSTAGHVQISLVAEAWP